MCEEKCRIAVIGAGVSGLCVIRNFARDPHYDITCFEIQDRVGGLWRYPEGCEIHPESQQDISSPHFARIYRYLQSNTFRDLSELRNFSYPINTACFLKHEEVLQYLQRYTSEHKLQEYVKFRHKVTQVTTLQPNWTSDDNSLGPQWSIEVENLGTSTLVESTFDVVIVCNGHHNKPYIPDIPTMDKFKGELVHSAFYRVPEPYRDKTVFIIGAGPSANDLTCELMNYAEKIFTKRSSCKEVFADRDKFSMIFPSPEKLEFTDKGFVNEEGGEEKLDTVILCTGFLHDFPFLTPECKVSTKRGQVEPLYRHIIHREYPSMAFIGLLAATPIAVGFEDQVLYYKAYLDQKFKLPVEEDMKKDAEDVLNKYLKAGFKEHHSLLMVPFRDRLFPYVDQLAEEGGFAPIGNAVKELLEENNDYIVYKPYELRELTYETVIGDGSKDFFVHKPEPW